MKQREKQREMEEWVETEKESGCEAVRRRSERGAGPFWTTEGVGERKKCPQEGGKPVAVKYSPDWMNEWLAVLNQFSKSYYSHKYYLC